MPSPTTLATLNGVYLNKGEWVAIYSATVTLASPAGRTTRVRHVRLGIDATTPRERAEAIADTATRPQWTSARTAS